MKIVNKLLNKIYKDEIIPASKKILDRGVSFFQFGPEKGIESYYEDRPPEEPYIFEINSNNTANNIKKLWEDEGLNELVEIVDPLMELADLLKEEEIDDDISPFIYTMF